MPRLQDKINNDTKSDDEEQTMSKNSAANRARTVLRKVKEKVKPFAHLSFRAKHAVKELIREIDEMELKVMENESALNSSLDFLCREFLRDLQETREKLEYIEWNSWHLSAFINHHNEEAVGGHKR